MVVSFSITACSGTADAPSEAAPVEIAMPTDPAQLIAITRTDTSKSDPVPENLIGTWVYSHDECDEELLADMGEGEVEKRDIRAQISFAEDRTYWMDIEGFPFSGSYRFAGGDHPRITLDTWLNFNVEGETLQNWSEGDAVYLCGRVFVREPKG